MLGKGTAHGVFYRRHFGCCHHFCRHRLFHSRALRSVLLADTSLGASFGSIIRAYRVRTSGTREVIWIAGLLLIAFFSLRLRCYDTFSRLFGARARVRPGAVIYGGGETFVGRALSLQPLVWVGPISYPPYLWHGRSGFSQSSALGVDHLNVTRTMAGSPQPFSLRRSLGALWRRPFEKFRCNEAHFFQRRNDLGLRRRGRSRAPRAARPAEPFLREVFTAGNVPNS